MKQILAQMNFLVDTETGEVDIKLNIDYTNEHSVEVFKDVLMKFANDVQNMTSKSMIAQREAELDNDRDKKINNLLEELENEAKLNEIVRSALPIFDI